MAPFTKSPAPTFTVEEQLAAREATKARIAAQELIGSEVMAGRLASYRDIDLAALLDNPNRILGTARLAPVASAKSEQAA